MGTSLWLCPRPNTALYDKLQTLMSSLNTLFPGSPPEFEPHVTITSNIVMDLDDKNQMHDDVDRILSASAVAVSSMPREHEAWIRAGSIGSQRNFFRKLYLEVERDPNLVSLARVIRELFVIAPSDLEAENRRLNPHLYTEDSHGNVVRRTKKGHGRSQSVEVAYTAPDTSEIQRNASKKASEWSINEFQPHLSLVYSDIYPIDNALWRTIHTRVQDYLGDEEVGWDGGVLKLVLCEGRVEDWVVLGSVDV